jgi:hypothetical protein
MRWFLPLVLAIFGLLVPMAIAHTCTEPGCGPCLEGTHEHTYVNGTLYCRSQPMADSASGRSVPGPSGLLVMAGVGAAALGLIALRR